MAFIKSILFLCLFAQYGHALNIRAKTDGVFVNCENQWCQQQAVYFVQYTQCESVSNWGKTCNNPKIDGNRGTDPIGLPIWTRQVKFIYSEKATKFCEIFTLLLTGTT